MNRFPPILAGTRSGRLTVLRRSRRKGWAREGYWLCACDCGNTTTVADESLRYARKTISCGCAHREHLEKFLASSIKHGGHIGKPTPEYRTWQAMMRRCVWPCANAQELKNYRGRGITVCERWRDFANFFADMGKKPSRAHSIDRINNDGNYEPGNCRWATRAEQTRNRRTHEQILRDNERYKNGQAPSEGKGN